MIYVMYVLNSSLTRGVVQQKSMAEAMEDLDSHNEQQPKSTHSCASKLNRSSTPGAHQIPTFHSSARFLSPLATLVAVESAVFRGAAMLVFHHEDWSEACNCNQARTTTQIGSLLRGSAPQSPAARFLRHQPSPGSEHAIPEVHFRTSLLPCATCMPAICCKKASVR